MISGWRWCAIHPPQHASDQRPKHPPQHDTDQRVSDVSASLVAARAVAKTLAMVSMLDVGAAPVAAVSKTSVLTSEVQRAAWLECVAAALAVVVC